MDSLDTLIYEINAICASELVLDPPRQINPIDEAWLPSDEPVRALQQLQQVFMLRGHKGSDGELHLKLEQAGRISFSLESYAKITGMELSAVQTQFGTTAETIPVGTVSCDRRKAGGPHAGDVRLAGVLNRWAKAKAHFRCAIHWTGPGAMPPDNYVAWKLQMFLGRDWHWWWGYRYADLTTRSFWKNGTSVVWYENDGSSANPTGTQIWFTYCRNDDYENLVGVWIYLRPPWFYNGVNPFDGNGRGGYIGDC